MLGAADQRRRSPPASISAADACRAAIPAGRAAAAVAAAAAVVVAVAAAVAASGAGGIGDAWAQAADTPPTLGVLLADTPPHYYKGADGRTVVVGQVVNTNSFAVSGVKVGVGFYAASGGEPLETVVGTTLAGVVPAGGTAPFAVSSESPDAAIADAAVTVLGFNYADEKPLSLLIEGASAAVAAEVVDGASGLAVEGEVRSTAPPGSPAEQPVTIHMFQYDAFDPPRLLRHASAVLDEPLEAGGSAAFSIGDALLVRADGVHLFAESAGAASAAIDVPIAQGDPQARRASIGDVRLADADGNRVQGGRVGVPLVVSGDVSPGAPQAAQPAQDGGGQDYTFYVQVKRSGDSPAVEFVGSQDGRLGGASAQPPRVEWVPDREGLYFVETFAWDAGNAPIAPRGPVVLVLVSGG